MAARRKKTGRGGVRGKRAVKDQPDRHNWAQIRSHWIKRNLVAGATTPYSLKRCAEDHKVSYQALRNRASKEGWRDQLRAKAEELADEAIERTREAAAIDEAEIRTRQVRLAQVGSNLAERALKAVLEEAEVGEDDLALLKRGDVKDWGMLLRNCLEQERKAAGLADRFEVEHDPRKDDGHLTPQQLIARQRRKRGLVERLAELADGG